MEEKLELLLLKLLAESPIFLAKIFSLKEVADSLALPTNCIARTPVRNFATRGARRIFSVKMLSQNLRHAVTGIKMLNRIQFETLSN